ncbi:MAG: sigma-70 family RNA polymerase sigma factor [Bacteroidota bacterium]
MDSAERIHMAQEQNDQIDRTVRKEGGRLLNFIRRRVRDDEDAQDIFQDVFSQFVEAYRRLEGIERVTSWLFRVARNKISDLYRKRKPEPVSRHRESDSETTTPSLQDILPDLSGNPEDLMMRDAIWEAVMEALDELPTAQREVFVWHEFEGIQFREIAEFTGETENTLRMRKYHAVQNLRQRLAYLYNEL